MAQAGWALGRPGLLAISSLPTLSLSLSPVLVSPHDLHPCLAPLSILGFGKNQTKSVTIFGGKGANRF